MVHRWQMAKTNQDGKSLNPRHKSRIPSWNIASAFWYWQGIKNEGFLRQYYVLLKNKLQLSPML